MNRIKQNGKVLEGRVTTSYFHPVHFLRPGYCWYTVDLCYVMINMENNVNICFLFMRNLNQIITASFI